MSNLAADLALLISGFPGKASMDNLAAHCGKSGTEEEALQIAQDAWSAYSKSCFLKKSAQFHRTWPELERDN